MNIGEFNALPFERQVEQTLETAQCLAGWWAGTCRVSLYYLPGGPFVEVYFDATAVRITRVQAMAPDQYLPHLPPLT